VWTRCPFPPVDFFEACARRQIRSGQRRRGRDSGPSRNARAGQSPSLSSWPQTYDELHKTGCAYGVSDDDRAMTLMADISLGRDCASAR
jgi:hypothetical protein